LLLTSLLGFPSEMGLGKTIEILALILSTRKERGSARSLAGKVEVSKEQRSQACEQGLGSTRRYEQQWIGEWGVTSENDTVHTVAAKCSQARGETVTPQQIVALNKVAFPALNLKTKFMKGMSIRLRMSERAAVRDVSSRTRNERAKGSGVKEEGGHEGLNSGDLNSEDLSQESSNANAAGLHSLAAEMDVVSGDAYGRVVAHGGTLIVVPVHLVSQWLCEIEKAVGSALNVKKYTAENKLHRRCAFTVGGAFIQQYASIASIQQMPVLLCNSMPLLLSFNGMPLAFAA
jgi:hypothetical protein